MSKVPFVELKITILSTLVLLLIAGSLCGCGGKKPLLQKHVTFRITPDADINNAQPVYLVIRKVNKTSFLVEDYDEVAKLVYADPPDDSLLAWKALLPGKKEEIKVAIPSESDVGIYGMFTQPDENWKIMIKSPLGSEYDIMIQDNRLKYRGKGGFWTWLKGIF